MSEQITIRKLDPELKRRLRIRAAEHGRSMEEEARLILADALARAPVEAPRNLVAEIRALFEPLGGVDLALPPREAACEPPRFET